MVIKMSSSTYRVGFDNCHSFDSSNKLHAAYMKRYPRDDMGGNTQREDVETCRKLREIALFAGASVKWMAAFADLPTRLHGQQQILLKKFRLKLLTYFNCMAIKTVCTL